MTSRILQRGSQIDQIENSLGSVRLDDTKPSKSKKLNATGNPTSKVSLSSPCPRLIDVLLNIQNLLSHHYLILAYEFVPSVFQLRSHRAQ